ncbi:MAG TPA: hypothetical protein VJT80_18285 [Steroidobacteraceae bacterium]|nr:hypothetical protein [Steroidobacteraceae bacterium]
MSTQLTRILSPGFALALAAGLALTACNRGESPKPEPGAAAATAPSANAEMAFARAALERNPDLEVVATDPQSGVVTVKHRSTGQVEAIKASELAATTPSQMKPMEMATAPPPEPEPAPVQEQSARAPAQTAQATAPDTGSHQAGTITSNGAYTVDRSGGKLRVTGPGVSIESSGTSAAASNQPGAGRRAVDPFICEGRRQLQLDGRDIYVDGDAITVRGGCEVFITNSHIVASGTAIVVQDAIVHVSNSHIEGGNASFQADDRAKMYVQGSTFTGIPRRAELAMVQDQGGNRWR